MDFSIISAKLTSLLFPCRRVWAEIKDKSLPPACHAGVGSKRRQAALMVFRAEEGKKEKVKSAGSDSIGQMFIQHKKTISPYL
jgi:hypothetical protein